MAQITRLTANLVTVGAQASPQSRLRQVAISPTIEAAPLPLGDSHLTLPEWSVRNGGPRVFQIVGDNGGSNLTGMGEAVAINTTEWGILGAIIMLIVTSGIVTTTEDDAGSPEGSRFSAAVSISAGFSQAFVCSRVSGVKMWCPFSGGSGGSGGSLIAHHEVEASGVVLANNNTTNVFTMNEFAAAAGTFLQITALLTYQGLGAPEIFTKLHVALKNNGATVMEFDTIINGEEVGELSFENFGLISIAWWTVAGGGAQLWSIDITTSAPTDGAQSLTNASMFINVLASP